MSLYTNIYQRRQSVAISDGRQGTTLYNRQYMYNLSQKDRTQWQQLATGANGQLGADGGKEGKWKQKEEKAGIGRAASAVSFREEMGVKKRTRLILIIAKKTEVWQFDVNWINKEVERRVGGRGPIVNSWMHCLFLSICLFMHCLSSSLKRSRFAWISWNCALFLDRGFLM